MGRPMTFRRDSSDGTMHFTEVRTWQFISGILGTVAVAWGLVAGPCILWVRSISRDEAQKLVLVEHGYNIESHATIRAEALASDQSMRLERMSQIDGLNKQLAEIDGNVKLLLARAVK